MSSETTTMTVRTACRVRCPVCGARTGEPCFVRGDMTGVRIESNTHVDRATKAHRLGKDRKP